MPKSCTWPKSPLKPSWAWANDWQLALSTFGLGPSARYLFCLALLAWSLGLVGCARTYSSAHPLLEARLDLAEAYLKNDLPRLSLRELKHPSPVKQDNKRYHLDLGLTFMALEKWDRAEAQLQEAVALDPDYGSAWNSLGRIYVARGRLRRAERAFKRALSILTYLEPEKAALNLARVYRQRSKGAQALKMSNLALEANRYYQPAYIFKNQLLLGQGRLELAIGCLKQASSRLPKDPKILLALAKDYIRAGDISNARKCFHDILGIAPKSKQAKVARDYLALL